MHYFFVYKFKEHTADIMIYVSSGSFKGALQDLMNAIVEIVNPKFSAVEPTIKKEHMFRAKFKEDLVIGFIEDVLYHLEVDHILPSRVIIDEADLRNMKIKYSIEGTSGFIENIIKAATFHRLIIKKEGDKWIMEVVLDV